LSEPSVSMATCSDGVIDSDPNSGSNGISSSAGRVSSGGRADKDRSSFDFRFSVKKWKICDALSDISGPCARYGEVRMARLISAE
jgi:hypothetical protein